MNGWIKLHRSVVESRSFDRLSDSESFKVIKIMLVVNCQEANYICPSCHTQLLLPAGSTAKSTRTLGKILKVSHTVIANLLRKMEKFGLITFLGQNCHRCFFFNNWHLYQLSTDELASKSYKQLESLDNAPCKPWVYTPVNPRFTPLSTLGLQEGEYIDPSFSFLKRGGRSQKFALPTTEHDDALATSEPKPTTIGSETMKCQQVTHDALVIPPEAWVLARLHAELIKAINPHSTVNSRRHSERRWAKAYSDFYHSFHNGNALHWDTIEYCLRWAMGDKYWRDRATSPAKFFRAWDTIYQQSKKPRRQFSLLLAPKVTDFNSVNKTIVKYDETIDDDLPF